MAGPTSLQFRAYTELYNQCFPDTPPPSAAVLEELNTNNIIVQRDEAIFIGRPRLYERLGTAAACPPHYALGEQAAIASVLIRQSSKNLQDFLGKNDTEVPHQGLLRHALSVHTLAGMFNQVINMFDRTAFPVDNRDEKQAHILLMLRICNVFAATINKFNELQPHTTEPTSVEDRAKFDETIRELNTLKDQFIRFHSRIHQEADTLTQNGEILDLAKLFGLREELNTANAGRGDGVLNASDLIQQARITLATAPEARDSIYEGLASLGLSDEKIGNGSSGGGAASAPAHAPAGGAASGASAAAAVAPAHAPVSLSHCFAISNLPAGTVLALRGVGGPLSWDSNYPIPYKVVDGRVTFTLPSSEIREYKFVAVRNYADADAKWEQVGGNRSLSNPIPSIQFEGPGAGSAPAECMSFRVHNLTGDRTLAIRGAGGPLSWGSNFEIRPTTRSDGSVIISIPQGITEYKFVAVQAFTGDVKWELGDGNRKPHSTELEGEITF